MSSQNTQKLRRNGSPSTKQGPIRATRQFGLHSPSRSLRRSPTSSPGPTRDTWSKASSESNEQQAATSPAGIKVEKPKPCLPGRSGSLDNLIAVPYLSGHWPKDGQWQGSKDGAFLPFRTFHTDKQTQTPEEWDDLNDRRHKGQGQVPLQYKRQSPTCGEQFRKDIKQKLQRKSSDSNRSSSIQAIYQQRHSPVPVCISPSIACPSATMPIKIPSQTSASCIAPKGTPGKTRGSIEGLNQEVEKLIIAGRGAEDLILENQDGHKAPVLELLTRSIDTQTPNSRSDNFLNARNDSSDSLPIMVEVIEADDERSSSQASVVSSVDRSESVSPSIPLIPGDFDIESSSPFHHPDYSNSPKLSSSPQPNSEFLREPPDGAEKVKIIDEVTIVPIDRTLLSAPNNPGHFQPSEHSAFHYLRTASCSPLLLKDTH